MLYYPKQDTHLDDGTEIPGTVKLVDINHNLHVREEKDIILVPQPTASPDDPLNWSTVRKHITLVWPMWYTFIVAVLAAVPAICYPQMVADLGISLGDMVAGSGYLFLFFGLGCLFWQPVATNFGRRPVYIYTILVGGIACPIWANFVSTPGQYYANRIICGFFLSSVESLGEVVVGDVYFTHTRGRGMSYYVLSLLSGSFLGPLAGSFINGSMGWHWLNYFIAIFSACGSIGTYFFMEETMFYRPAQTSEVVVAEEEDVSDSSPVESVNGAKEKAADASAIIAPVSESGEGIISEDSSALRRTYFQRYPILFYRAPEQPSRFVQSVIRPIKIFYLFFPVVWSGLIVASALAWWSVAGATIAAILAEPPYNFGSTGLGLVYLAPMITAVICVYIGGEVSDAFCIWMARRNNGVREPEFRLYMGFIALIFTPAGLWLYGIGAAHDVSWVAIVFGYAFSTVGTVLGASIPYTYAYDCFPAIGPDSMVTVILIRNLIGGFAFSYAITPWIAHNGYQNTFIILGFFSVAFWISSIPMILFGKNMRRKGAKIYHEWAKTSAH